MTRAPSGVLLLDKPVGWTSNAALGRARRLLGGVKAGHTGTLDPFASGLLPITVGEAGKFSRYVLDSDKRYLATLRLGHVSTTGDPEGEVTVTGVSNALTLSKIEGVLASFLGEQRQIPPMHSALKQNGVPLYRLARQGVEVERPARNIRIHAIRLESWDGSEALIVDVHCSKGTYVRVLAQDIGRELGVGAYLTGLHRIGAGAFGISEAISLAALEEEVPETRLSHLRPASCLVSGLPRVTLDRTDARALLDGKHPETTLTGHGEVQAWGPNDTFLGVAALNTDRGGARLIPVRLMSPNVLP